MTDRSTTISGGNVSHPGQVAMAVVDLEDAALRITEIFELAKVFETLLFFP